MHYYMLSSSVRKACSLFMSIVLAVGMTVPSTAFADKGNAATDAAGVSDGSEKTAEVVDITAEWNKGSLQITKGGTYYLSGDVQTSGSLTVAVPYGEEAKIDFCGHDATVAGVVSSGIDVSQSAGSVTITDTLADSNAKSDQRSALKVQANKAGEVTCGILANFVSAGAGEELSPSLTVSNINVAVSVNTVDAAGQATRFDSYGIYAGYSNAGDADKAIGLNVEDCSIEAALNIVGVDADKAAELLKTYGEKVLTNETSGLAAGLFFANKGAALQGSIDASADSQNEAAGIYLKDDAVFQVGSDFTSEGILVYGAKLVDGAAFAMLQGEAPENVEGMFGYSVAPEQYECDLTGNSLVFGQREVAGGAEASAVSVDDAPIALTGDSGAEGESAVTQVSSVSELKTALRKTGETYIELSKDLPYVNPTNGTVIGTKHIDLKGHALTKASFKLSSGANLELTDSSEQRGSVGSMDNGWLKVNGSGTFSMSNIAVRTAFSSHDALSTTNLGFRTKDSSTTNSFALSLGVEGDVSINNCAIEFDASNLDQFQYGEEREITALLASSGSKVSISNSELVCKAPSKILKPDNLTVNSNGAFINGNISVDFANVSFDSTSGVGSACGVTYGSSYGASDGVQTSISEKSSFNLDSSSADAYGIRALGSWEKLHKALSLNASIDYLAECSGSNAFLRALGVGSDSVLLGDKFESESGALPLFIGKDGDEANTGGSAIFGYMDGFVPTVEYLKIISNSFCSYSDNTAGVSAGGNGVTFNEYTEKNGAAYIESAGARNYYRNFYQASKDVRDGETICLNPVVTGADVIAFQKTTEESSSSDASNLKYAVDLNGVNVREFKCASGAKVTLKSSAEGGQVLRGAEDGGYATAVSMTGSGELVLDPSVTVEVEGSTPIHAVSVTGGTFSASTSDLLTLIAGGASSAPVAIKASGENGAGAVGVYVNMATVNLTGIAVEAKSTNGMVHGVYLGGSSTANLNRSVVTALGSDMAKTYVGVAGVYAAGTGAFMATDTTITAESKDCSAESSYSAGVYVAGKNVTLTRCTVEEQSSGSSASSKEAGVYVDSGTLALAGECGIASSAEHSDIAGLKSPLQLSSSFVSKNNKVLGVQLASGFSDDFAKRPAGDDENFTDSQKKMFFAWLDGENWDLRVRASGNVLELDRDVVATIDSTDYYVLSKAFEKAVDGDTIKLAADVSAKSALDLSSSTAGTNRSITLDLAGHTLTVAGSDITNAVVVPSNTGLTVKNSENTGSMNLKCSEKGFKVDSDASLVLDGANVDVQFNGEVNYVYGGSGEICIAGIAPGGTSWQGVSLKNSANLTVESQGASVLASGNTGAPHAYGISLPSSASGQMLSIDSASSVKVNNSSQLLAAGSVSVSTDQDAQGAVLRELSLDEGSELYGSIWDEFYKTAKYDKTKGVYYAAPLTVGNAKYWVLSEQVSEPTGTKDEVKPATIYVRGTYQVAPEAVGISSSSALAGGTVDVSGTVSAESENGNAFAVQASDSATWNVNGATLSAVSKAKGAYRGKTAENTSLYPNSQNPLIVDVAPQAAALKTSNSNQSFVLDGAVSISSSTAFKGEASSQVNCASADIIADSVTCGSSFGLKDETSPISVLAISGKNEQGAAFAKAAEGVLSGKASLFEDATGQYGAVVAADGTLVWGGSYNVQFVDCYGNVVSQMADVADGQTVALPDANKLFRDRDSEYVYTFLGWSTNKDAEDAVIPATGTTMEFASGGVAEQTITYYPVYSKAHHQTTVNFERLCSSDGQLVNGNGSISATIDTGKTVKQAIDENSLELSFAQSYSKEDGTKYVFVGWTTRGITKYDDVNASVGGYLDDGAMRTIELSANAVSDTTITLTANYVPVKSDQYLAKFKVGNIVFAQAVNVGTAPSWKENSGYKENTNNLNYPSGLILERVKPEGVSTLTFKGWHAGSSDSLTVPDGQKPDYTADDALKGAEAGGTVMYTAWFDTVSSNCAIKMCLYQQGADGKFYSTRTAYSTNGSGYYAATYGTEPSSIVKDLPKSFVQDGKTYTFKGWSVRETDTEPIWEDGKLPTVTTSATYWAVYDVAEQKVNVTFMNGSETYKTLPGVEVSKSLDDMAVEAPQPADDNQEFLGWSAQQGATSGMNATASLKDLLGGSLTGDTTQVTFYAVYGEKSSYNVTMHYQFKDQAQTLSAKAYDDGTVVLPSDFSYENALVYGKYLAGWATTEGATEPDFDLSKDKVSGNANLYAVYKDISVNATQGQGASIDASGAYVATQGAIGASDVTARIVKADSIDKNLASKASGLLNRGNYTVSLGYSNGSESSTTQVNGNFGNLSISIPVASEDADRNFQVYWIQENGTFGGLSTSESTQVDEGKIKVEDDGQGGKVLKFSIASYGDSMFGGNLMVCAEKTSLEKAQDNYLTQLKEYWNKLGGDNEEDGIQDNYSDDDFTKLKQAYENGEKAIKAATSEDEALAAANEAVANLLAVPTRSTLQNAKAYALDKLADDFSGYNKSNYTDANWTQLEAAYKAAKENINNATTANDANSACNKGISAMASVSTKTDSDSGSASSGSGSSAASGSGLSSSGASGSGSSLASSSGSGLSGSSGSGLESSSGSGLTSLGSTVQQMLGAKYETVTSDLVADKGLIATSGVYVSEVTDGGAAQKAGLEVGDVITAVNGTQVSSVEELESVLADVKAGDTVEFTVDRNGKKLTLTATLDEASGLSSGLSTNSAGLGSSAVGSGSDTGSGADVLKTLRDYLPWVVLGLLVLLAAVAGLVWWLLRRRNNGSEEELLETEGDADSQEDANTFQF